MLFLTIYEMLARIGSPANWPLWLRRLFIILFPITIPLLIMLWFGIIILIVVSAVAGIMICLVAELFLSIGDLWKKQ